MIRDTDWSKTEILREWRNVVDGKIGYLDILILNRDADCVTGRRMRQVATLLHQTGKSRTFKLRFALDL